MNIIGDIAGRFDELKLLIRQLPGGKIILVGDLVDRGPKSKEVIQFCIDNPHIIALRGNHEDIFIDWYYNHSQQGDRQIYQSGVFGMNGGGYTLKSYIGLDPIVFEDLHRRFPDHRDVPEEHIKYLDTLPLFYETDDLIISHAPINSNYKGEWFDLVNNLDRYRVANCLWNRRPATRRKDNKLQIHGHNAGYNITYDKDKQGIYCVNVDSSRGDKLTALHYPTMEVFEQEYLK